MITEQYSLHSSQPQEHLPLPLSQEPYFRYEKIGRIFKLPPITLMKLSNTYFQPISNTNKVINIRTHTDEIEDSSQIKLHIRSISSLGKNTKVEERRKLSDLSFLDKKCGVCYENECNAVIMECGHGGICYQCAEVVLENNQKCHMCRGNITQILKIKIEPKKVLNVVGLITRVNSQN